MSVDNIGETKIGRLARDLYLVEEITRRILNDYGEAIAALELASILECGPTKLALNSAAARLWARAQAHRALQPPMAGGVIELSDYLEQVCAALSAARLAERGAWLTLVADEVWLDADRCWLVGLIVAELINNAARHGLSGGPGAISVKIVNREWRVICAVANCGSISGGRRGRGRRLVEAMAAELGGMVEWACGAEGCSVSLEFPTARPAHRVCDLA